MEEAAKKAKEQGPSEEDQKKIEEVLAKLKSAENEGSQTKMQLALQHKIVKDLETKLEQALAQPKESEESKQKLQQLEQDLQKQKAETEQTQQELANHNKLQSEL